jgi:hypothetical protein
VETTTAPGATAHLAQRRPAMAASAWRSDSSRSEPRTTGRWLRTGRACGRDGTREARRRRGQRGMVGRVVGTPTRGPDSALKAHERCSTWQPCGNGALPGGPDAARGV